MPSLDAINCFQKGLNDALIGHHDAMTLIGTDRITYVSFTKTVSLNLIPRENMTWKMWSAALLSFIDFTLEGMEREWQFILLEDGHDGEVGYGSIEYSAGKSHIRK